MPLGLRRRRLPTPGFFAILGRNIRADRGADVPAAARRWVGDCRRHVELIQIDARVNEREPANSWFRMARPASSPGFALLGEGKGVWDCERRRIAMFVGSERRSAAGTTIESEEDARRAISGRCGRRPKPLVRLHGQGVVLCAAPRR
jgi:hypothetical protein